MGPTRFLLVALWPWHLDRDSGRCPPSSCLLARALSMIPHGRSHQERIVVRPAEDAMSQGQAAADRLVMSRFSCEAICPSGVQTGPEEICKPYPIPTRAPRTCPSLGVLRVTPGHMPSRRVLQNAWAQVPSGSSRARPRSTGRSRDFLAPGGDLGLNGGVAPRFGLLSPPFRVTVAAMVESSNSNRPRSGHSRGREADERAEGIAPTVSAMDRGSICCFASNAFGLRYERRRLVIS